MRVIVKPSIFFMVFACLLAAARPAGAQSVAQPKSWNVTPFLNASMGLSDPASNDSMGLGVAVGYDWTSNLGFEGEIGHLFDVAGDTDDIDWSVTSFSANALYHFDVRRITPYATFGLGMERSSAELRVDDPLEDALDPSATEFSFNFGGGVKYPINGRMLARVDLRRFQANDLAPDYWRVYGGLTFAVGR